MKNSWIGIAIVVVVLLMICGNACSTYNSLVTLEQEVNKAWGNVEAQYQRRYDLIPNLVETVKGYAQHESQTYENVTKARAGLTDAYNNAKASVTDENPTPESMEKFMGAQDQLNKAFTLYVNAVHEAYPDLKANENFRDLQVQLEGTENRIATERINYNNVVNDYNIKVRRFPGNIWSGIFGFSTKPLFKADQEAQSAPKVQF